MLEWNGPKFVAALNAAAGQAVAEVAHRVLDTAIRNCPVDTGALRGSGRVYLDPNESTAYVVFGDDVIYYAYLVHEGTARQNPQPWLAQAVLQERTEAENQFASLVLMA